jgi:hypothetical protein
VWLALQLGAQFVPFATIVMYMLYGQFLFIPVTGRMGKTVNPDVLVGSLTATSVIFYTCYLVSEHMLSELNISLNYG